MIVLGRVSEVDKVRDTKLTLVQRDKEMNIFIASGTLSLSLARSLSLSLSLALSPLLFSSEDVGLTGKDMDI